MEFVRRRMRLDIVASRTRVAAALVVATAAVGAALPVASQSPEATERPDIVVTSPILGAVVSDLVGTGATVTVLMGNGVDPHDWSPSARDVEAVHEADLVVANGLGLEAGLDDALDDAAANSVPVFRATDHIAVRTLDDEHDAAASGASEDEDHGHGAVDPHFWVDPLAMRDVVLALGPVVEGLGVDVSVRLPDLTARLEVLDSEVRTILEVVPPERRRLVTGHESMGYFADRYGLGLIGAVIPGLSSTGEVSASQLSAIAATVRESGVPVIFTEIGTPQAVVDAIAGETGVRVVPLPSHNLPEDGSYFSFIRQIATAIAGALG